MKIVLFFLTLICTSLLHAQLNSGTISYVMHYGFGEEQNVEASFKIEFNDQFVKWTSTNPGMPGTTIGLKNLRTDSIISYMQSDEEKIVQFFAISGHNEDAENDVDDYYYEEEEDDDTEESPSKDFYKKLLAMPLNDTIVYRSTATKTILGYTCHKIVLKYGEYSSQTFWVTDEIKGLDKMNSVNPYFTGAYLAMEYKTSVNTFTLEATEVTATNSLSEREQFQIPEGYVLFLGQFVGTQSPEGNFDAYIYIPHFINPGDRFKSNLNSILEEFRDFYSGRENPLNYDNVKITIDTRGKIVGFDTDYSVSNDSEKDKSKLLKRIQKKCVFEPVTMNGVAVPCAFRLADL